MKKDSEGNPTLILSIIIPCYNVENFLPCLLEQFELLDTLKVEFIFIDDASIDKTKMILEEFTIKTFHNVKTIFHEINQGQSVARNHGLELASGEYIWFLDSDDLIVEKTLRQSMKILSEERPEVLLTGLYSFKHRKHYCHPEQVLEKDIISKEFFSFLPNEMSYGSDKILYSYFKSVMMYPCCTILHRKCIDDIRFPVGKKLEDVETMPKYISMAKSCYYLPLPIVYYRRRPESTMTTKEIKTFIDYSRSMYDLVEFFSDKRLSEKVILQMFISYLTILRWSLNDMIKLDILNDAAWTEYNKSIMMFWSKTPYGRSKLFIALLQSYSLKKILVSTIFLISPKLYAKFVRTIYRLK